MYHDRERYSPGTYVNDADVEATLRDIREQARAVARAAVADRVDERAAPAVPGPQPAGGAV